MRSAIASVGAVANSHINLVKIPPFAPTNKSNNAINNLFSIFQGSRTREDGRLRICNLDEMCPVGNERNNVADIDCIKLNLEALNSPTITTTPPLVFYYEKTNMINALIQDEALAVNNQIKLTLMPLSGSIDQNQRRLNYTKACLNGKETVPCNNARAIDMFDNKPVYDVLNHNQGFIFDNLSIKPDRRDYNYAIEFFQRTQKYKYLIHLKAQKK